MNKPGGSERLIFVGGCPRSGTTLIQNMLDSHPDIFGGPEFLHLQDVIELRKKLRRSISVGWIDLFCSYEDLDGHLRALIQNILLPLADKHGGKYMSEKSPDNILAFSELVELFPEAHFIHIVRDPRAIVSSMQDVCARAKQKNIDIPAYTATPSSRIAYTTKCFDSGFAAVKKFPDKILTVVYESLVKDPEKETLKICRFIGLEWDSRMLAPQKKKHLGEKAITTKSDEIWYDVNTYYQEPHDRNIEKWKKRLSAIQQIRVSRAFKHHKELKALGYDFSLRDISGIKRFHITIVVSVLEFGLKLYKRFLSIINKILKKLSIE